MLDLILFLLAIFLIANFFEYKAIIWAYKRGGFGGVFRMVIAIVVRLTIGLFIKD